ncbi:hypothetical protein EV715DRAFT_252729 [Schizophyllum commune]
MAALLQSMHIGKRQSSPTSVSPAPSKGGRVANLLSALQKDTSRIATGLRSTTTSILAAIPRPKSKAAVDRRKRPATTPAYLEPCYTWLLNNLHNPYPSHEERLRFSVDTGSSMKDIAAWFISARQRIGWSELRAKQFGRSQIGIVKAASRFWPERDTNLPLPPDIELRFAEIDANARSLYAGKFEQSDALRETLKRLQQAQTQDSKITSSDVTPSRGKKRAAAEAGLEIPNEPGPSKKTRRPTTSHHRSASLAAQPTASSKLEKRRHASLPSFGTAHQARASSSSSLAVKAVPAPLPPPLPKFGETSLAAPAISSISLKRSRDSEESSNGEPSKRHRTLPTWPDPQKLPLRSKSSRRRTSTSSSPSSERAAHRDRRRVASDPQPSTTQPLPLDKASARASSLPPLPDPASGLPAPILPWPLPPSPPPQLVSTPSTDLSADLPTPQSDMAFLTMDDASCTWAIDGVSQFDVNAVPDPNSLDMTLGDPFLQGDPYFNMPATFADIDWDALLSQPLPCEPQPLPWESQPLRCEPQPLPCEPLTTAQWDIYGTSTEPAYCGQDTFASTYGDELPLGQFLTGFTDDLIAPESIAATA